MTTPAQAHSAARSLVLMVLLLLAGTAVLGAPAPYVILKLDDLTEDYGQSWWQGFQWATDECKTRGVKCSVGIFAKSVETPSAAYLAYVRSLCNDPDREVWEHGYTGRGPDGTDGTEFTGSPYQYQKDAVVNARLAMLAGCDYLMRSFNPHWYNGDATTVQVFNEDPFLRVYLLDAPSGINAASVFNNLCELEPGDTHQVNDLATFVTNYNGCISMPYFTLQGHPWAWSVVSRTNFSQILLWLNSQGARYILPWSYYELTQNINDTTPPPLPTGLVLTRINSQSIQLAWTAASDPESGISGYTIYRNGQCVNITTATNYTDTSTQILPDSTRYQVRAINGANLFSPKSPATVLGGSPRPLAPTTLRISQ